MYLYKLGRLFQLLGMFLLPIGVAGNVMDRIDLKTSLTISGIGMGVFFLGYLIQEQGKK